MALVNNGTSVLTPESDHAISKGTPLLLEFLGPDILIMIFEQVGSGAFISM